MIRPGDTLENPVTGEVLIFHRTSAQTGGESVLVETIVRPDGFVAAAHVHPHQTERFEVLDGLVGLRVGAAAAASPSPATSPWFRPEPRTGSGTRASARPASSARCGPRSRSSR